MVSSEKMQLISEAWARAGVAMEREICEATGINQRQVNTAKRRLVREGRLYRFAVNRSLPGAPSLWKWVPE